jgi:hypothetical protein
MKRQNNPRLEYIDAGRANFAEQRRGFYLSHRGLVNELQKGISTLVPIYIPDVRKLLLIGNQRTAEIIGGFFDTIHKLKDPQPGEYMLSIKECTDARAVCGTVYSYFRRTMIHERTAGASVRNGHVFSLLNTEFGIGVIVSHFACGGENVANRHHTGQIDGYSDLSIRGIVEAVPAGIARIPDPILRTKCNCRSQVATVDGILESIGMGNSIYPTMLTWENWPKINLLWLGVNQSRTPELVNRLEASAQTLWGVALELGRSPKEQYAHTIAFYDPTRLGRFNDPRVIFDSLPNEMFCVTENFDGFENGSTELSNSALGSLRYAGFLNGGHVFGVGHRDGTRHVLIIDTDASVVRKVKNALLASSEDIRDLTCNGETITMAVYNLETHLVTFID